MNTEVDNSVANILISLAGTNSENHSSNNSSSTQDHGDSVYSIDGNTENSNKKGIMNEVGDNDSKSNFLESRNYARLYAEQTIEKIRAEVANILSGDDDAEFDTVNVDLLQRDRSSCTSHELDMIRRERNRMHAKRTRLRKKKMLQEMEAVSCCYIYIFLKNHHHNNYFFL